MNIQRQTKLDLVKQRQIEDFVKYNKIDILNVQEIDISDDTFSECNFISSSFNIIPNNSDNGYGTACLIRSDLDYSNVRCDTSGRAILFKISDVSFGNFYAHSGTDNISKQNREQFFSETIPSLLTNLGPSGCIGGDLNSIIEKIDATNHPAAKLSQSFKRLSDTFHWKDSYRSLYPTTKQFSHYYGNSRAEGATRIDRCYHFGEIRILQAAYLPLAFSDHHALVVKIILPNPFSRLLCPKQDYAFRIKAEVVNDIVFRNRLKEAMLFWQSIRSFGLDLLVWWENIVKPGIKKLAQKRSREILKDMRWELNLLRLRQTYLNRKLSQGETWWLAELKVTHLCIIKWYENEAQKIKYQSQVAEHQFSEKVRVYHHSLHQKKIKKSSILKLETPEGLKVGHSACAEYLERIVEEVLNSNVGLNPESQNVLLNEVDHVFSDEDNNKLLAVPSQQEVWLTLLDSNLHAAPGTDGLTNYFYKECFDIVGGPLTEVVAKVFSGSKPTHSQRTSKMVFGCKPKKSKSLNPKDKRRISLLNCDFKTISGVYARRFKASATYTLSPLQLVAGDDRRIHHGINLARDAINACANFKSGCGIADTDYEAAFDYLVMSWVFLVLQKKGVSPEVIRHLENLYQDNLSIVVVNNIAGKVVCNDRLSLRQGDIPSMYFFAFGIDPLITYLERRLAGIKICSLPMFGPVTQNSQLRTLPCLEERYKVISYADDLKPAVTSMEEFTLIDRASALFESASGCRLHRNPSSKKCKFLPLGKWRKSLKQTDLPQNCQYLVLSDHLDMVGVELRATWTQTKKSNGDMIQERVAKTINSWRSGKFMPLSMRPSSINCYVLSKVWFKCSSVDLRMSDVLAINSSVKSWLYSDMFEKPSEQVMCRPTSYGGLGVISVKNRAQAALIRSFMETAAHPKFRHSLLHSHMFRYHVLGETSLPNPGFRPYYPDSFFQTIKKVHENTTLDVRLMTTGQWTRLLTEYNLTMEQIPNQQSLQFIPCRTERSNPQQDWQLTWRLSRLKGLNSEMMTFNFKLLHGLLPVKGRINEMTPSSPAECNLCSLSCEESLYHAFVSCTFNHEVFHSLVKVIKMVLPNVTNDELLRFSFKDLSQSQEFPVMFVVSSFLLEIWSRRVKKSKICLYEIRTTIEAKCSLLRETRFNGSCATIQDMLINL